MSRGGDKQYIEELEAELRAARPIVEAHANLMRFLDEVSTRQVVFQATWASPPFRCSTWQPKHAHRNGTGETPFAAFQAALDKDDISYEKKEQPMNEAARQLSEHEMAERNRRAEEAQYEREMENRQHCEDNFFLGFTQMQEIAHQCAVTHGWWETDRGGAEAIALMHSELSEALEYMRTGDGPSDHIPNYSGVTEEFTDVIIRIMDYAGKHNLNIAGALIEKVRFNEARPHKHGGKSF